MSAVKRQLTVERSDTSFDGDEQRGTALVVKVRGQEFVAVEVRPALDRILVLVYIDCDAVTIRRAVFLTLLLAGHVEVVLSTECARVVQRQPLRCAVYTHNVSNQSLFHGRTRIVPISNIASSGITCRKRASAAMRVATAPTRATVE